MRTKVEILSDIRTKEAELKALHEELSTAQRATTRDNSKQYQNRKAMLLEASKHWEQILQTGDYIKVTGSRTSPYRKVMSISNGFTLHNGNWSPGVVITAVCTSDRKGNIRKCDEFNIIQCHTDKIVSRLTEDGSWQNASSMLKTNIDD